VFRNYSAPDPSSGIAPHSMLVPLDSSLSGFTATLQGLILGRRSELCNAVDIVLGF
jgi:hypothetical protein